ncbi:MAG: hypothetical protein A2W33_00915 [Chloroflexi bacterium RBG_16_52_11]|nr:MAG: hypothetical protein A2W33_00915 [Chloroflexi bacterium RBG_16_52_11]
MRIGMMADLYKPHISGVTNYISLSKQNLEMLGHEVFVFTFGSETYQDEESNVICSQGMPFLDTGYHFNLRHTRHARNLIRTMDIVHVHHPFISGSLAIRYCRPYLIPIVFTSHTRYDLYAQAYFPVPIDVIGETAIQTYLPVFCRAIDMVIAPSNGMREVLIRFGVDVPIEVVPNGVDLEPFRKSLEPRQRSDLGFSQEDVLLIFVGRLGPEKNLAFLIRAFYGLIEAFPNVGLILVGDGPDRDNLQDRVRQMGIAHRVYFSGSVPYNEVPGMLAMADAFVTASVTEVHPLSVIEAMGSGLPVLGIQSPGVGDIIADGVTGLLVQSEDIASFTAKMARMVTNHIERRKMGERASVEAEIYDIRVTTKNILEHYTTVIENTGLRKLTLRDRFIRLREHWGR